MAEKLFKIVSKDEAKLASGTVSAAEMYLSRTGDVALYRFNPDSGRNTVFLAMSSGTWELVYEVNPNGEGPY